MYAPIETVKARYQKRLFQYPGVVSVGIGFGEIGERVLVVGLLEELLETTAKKLPPVLDGYSLQLQVLERSQVVSARLEKL